MALCCNGNADPDDVYLEEDTAADLAWRIYTETGGTLERNEFEKQDLADEWSKVIRLVPAYKYGDYLEEGKATDLRQYVRYLAVMGHTYASCLLRSKVEPMTTFMAMSFRQRGCYILYLSCTTDSEPATISGFVDMYPNNFSLVEFFMTAHLIRDTFDDDLPMCGNFVSTVEMLAMQSETTLKRTKPSPPVEIHVESKDAPSAAKCEKTKLGPISFCTSNDALSYSDSVAIGHYLYNDLIAEVELDAFKQDLDACGPVTLALAMIDPYEARDILREAIEHDRAEIGLRYLKYIMILGCNLHKRSPWNSFKCFSAIEINRFLRYRNPVTDLTIEKWAAEQRSY